MTLFKNYSARYAERDNGRKFLTVEKDGTDRVTEEFLVARTSALVGCASSPGAYFEQFCDHRRDERTFKQMGAT